MEVMRCIFGSHLYGTDTPASDKDFKGIDLSSWEEVALGRIPKQYEHYTSGNNETKNTSHDVDVEIFSLHTFVKEALEGQTFALDMMHAPKDKLIITSEIWEDLVANREKFYNKNIESFIGYAMGQASKYGIKGSRLNDAKAVLDWMDKQLEFYPPSKDSKIRIIDCDLRTFPEGEHIEWHIANQHEQEEVVLAGTDMIEVCNRKILLNSKLSYARDMVQKFYDAYGERAKKAASDEGIDWKAISHAFRAAFQIRELFTEGTITFPRREHKFLTNLKLGEYKYNAIAPHLERIIDEVKVLREKSTLPETPDKAFWDQWLMNVVEQYVVPK